MFLFFFSNIYQVCIQNKKWIVNIKYLFKFNMNYKLSQCYKKQILLPPTEKKSRLCFALLNTVNQTLQIEHGLRYIDVFRVHSVQFVGYSSFTNLENSYFLEKQIHRLFCSQTPNHCHFNCCMRYCWRTKYVKNLSMKRNAFSCFTPFSFLYFVYFIVLRPLVIFGQILRF